jgi:hypothetical protein
MIYDSMNIFTQKTYAQNVYILLLNLTKRNPYLLYSGLFAAVPFEAGLFVPGPFEARHFGTGRFLGVPK